jgi:hypothetical protein
MIPVALKMCVDIFTHSIYLLLFSSQPVGIAVFYGNWRTKG